MAEKKTTNLVRNETMDGYAKIVCRAGHTYETDELILSKLLELALVSGWQPSDMSTLFDDGRRISSEDARAFARALDSALDELPDAWPRAEEFKAAHADYVLQTGVSDKECERRQSFIETLLPFAFFSGNFKGLVEGILSFRQECLPYGSFHIYHAPTKRLLAKKPPPGKPRFPMDGLRDSPRAGAAKGVRRIG